MRPFETARGYAKTMKNCLLFCLEDQDGFALGLSRISSVDNRRSVVFLASLSTCCRCLFDIYIGIHDSPPSLGGHLRHIFCWTVGESAETSEKIENQRFARRGRAFDRSKTEPDWSGLGKSCSENPDKKEMVNLSSPLVQTEFMATIRMGRFSARPAHLQFVLGHLNHAGGNILP